MPGNIALFMIRNLSQFETGDYDLIVVGGGINGAAICWEAVSRGLKVALLEKSDFAAATSANSLKIIHGGFRYLQSGNILRVKESIREQRNLMQLAPHLVHPMPVIIPIYGHGIRGKEAFATGVKLFELIRSSERKLDDPEKHIPPGRIISKGECTSILPNLEEKGLKGGVLFYDAQVYNSERLVLAFLQTAWKSGAHIANYAEVTGFIEVNRRLKGVEVRDVLTGEVLRITSKLIILASGPWNEEILSMLGKESNKSTVIHAKAINLITRQLINKFAVGIRGRNQYSNGKSLANVKTNYIFIAPWRDFSIIGTAYTLGEISPDELEINESDIDFIKNEFNRVNPGNILSNRDILLAHGGLLPLSGKKRNQQGLQLASKMKIIDYRELGYEGLLAIEGVKYTTARDVAQKTINYVFSKWGYNYFPSISEHTQLFGGEINRFDSYMEDAIRNNDGDLSINQIKSLILNYGSAYSLILNLRQELLKNDPGRFVELKLLEAQILHAVNSEMAQRLGDVVFRRTELGSGGDPGDELLRFSADVVGRELNWSQTKQDQELADVKRVFFPYKQL